MLIERRFTKFVDPQVEGENGLLTPIDYYHKILQDSGSFVGTEYYCSSPISSANFGQLMAIDPEKYPVSCKTQLIKLNGILNEQIGAELQKSSLNGIQLTLPHRIPYMKGWKEFDYLTFWMMYFSRLSYNSSSRFVEEIRTSNDIDLDLFNDYSGNRLSRWREYKKLEPFYKRAIELDEDPANKIDAMIAFPGHKKSLGCSVELTAALAAGIPVYQVAINQDSADYKDDLHLKGYGWAYLRSQGIVPDMPVVSFPEINNLLVLKRAFGDDVSFEV